MCNRTLFTIEKIPASILKSKSHQCLRSLPLSCQILKTSFEFTYVFKFFIQHLLDIWLNGTENTAVYSSSFTKAGPGPSCSKHC